MRDAPTPTHIGFVGSIKWHDQARFGPPDAGTLAGDRAEVPGAAGAKLVAARARRFIAAAGACGVRASAWCGR